MLAAALVGMVVDGPHTARTPRLTMRVLRSCRPAARWTGPVWCARAGGSVLSRPLAHRSSVIAGVLLMPGGRRNGDETTVFILRMAAKQILPASGVRIEALSASGRGPYSSSGVTRSEERR